jgi:hypothetical protein
MALCCAVPLVRGGGLELGLFTSRLGIRTSRLLRVCVKLNREQKLETHFFSSTSRTHSHAGV